MNNSKNSAEQLLKAIIEAAKSTERHCYLGEGCTCGAFAFASFVVELEKINLRDEKMSSTKTSLVEKMAQKIHDDTGFGEKALDCCDEAESALEALCTATGLTPEILEQIADGSAVVVPSSFMGAPIMSIRYLDENSNDNGAVNPVVSVVQLNRSVVKS